MAAAESRRKFRLGRDVVGTETQTMTKRVGVCRSSIRRVSGGSRDCIGISIPASSGGGILELFACQKRE